MKHSFKYKPLESSEVLHKEDFSTNAILLCLPSKDKFYFYTGSIDSINTFINGILEQESLNSEFFDLKYLCKKSSTSNLTKLVNKKKWASVKGRDYTHNFEFFVIGKNGKFRTATQNISTGQVTKNNGPCKVLVVDDSKTLRKILTNAISKMDGFTVIAETGNPLEVKDLIEKVCPDVMTLDIHMPHLNGVELLEKLGDLAPPTIVVSSLSLAEGDLVIRALELGAFDYQHKPALENSKQMLESLEQKLNLAAKQGEKRKNLSKRKRSTYRNNTPSTFRSNLPLFIGSSTGGTEALKEVLLSLPQSIPPILIVQHIPPIYSKSLANRLNQLCPFTVKEAEDGDLVKPNLVLIAEGGKQMEYSPKNGGSVRVFEAGPRNGHVPSVDTLFDSAAKHLKSKCIGIILTGMGKDGAVGLKNMLDSGAHTIGQDEDSCVVFGMPKAAIALGAVKDIQPLSEIGPCLIEYTHTRNKKRSA